ncbi:ABC transporter permease subunit [Mycoplasmopsis phocirhinis]|uniref:ABC transporter permease subunit n=1 Tax=Mycoplasmopsis phocirhinis TaxID=142650 RepID=A0A4P6MSC0_9BACT|nr:ABC transporter permease subunit [Mycoplasmopsis phocirhinis]QBF34564.1 ABC transporter permease subunit [Mycoplasmopsis phocirhinis]
MKQINDFRFKKNVLLRAEILNAQSAFKRFSQKFFNSKIAIFSFVALIVILLSTFFSFVFYKHKPDQAINNSFALNTELPSSLNGFKHIILPESDELNVYRDFAKQFPKSVFIQRIIDDNDGLINYSVKFNAYQIFNDNNIYLLGTNSQGIDIYARIIYSFANLLLISTLSVLISIFLSIFIGGLIATHFKKEIAKIFDKIFTTFALIPYILFSLFLFLVLDPNIINSIVIFSTISTISLSITAYQKSVQILQNEFINAEKAIGFSQWHIFSKTLIKPLFFNILILAIEQISLTFISYSAISIFNLNKTKLLLGLIILEALNLFEINPSYIITISLLITIYIFSLKNIAFELNRAYINQRGENA